MKGLPTPATPNPGVHIPGRFPGLGTRIRIFFYIFYLLILDIFCKFFFLVVKSLNFVSLFF